MKLFCSIVFLACSAAACHAQPIQNIRMEWANEQHTLARAIAVDDVLDPSANWYYDNYRDQVRGGQSQRLEMYRVGSDEVGDLVVSDVGGGRLRGENFTLAHVGQTGVGTYITKRNRWYDGSGQLIREFVFDIDMSLAHLTPGLLKNYSAGDGFWDFLNLDLPSSTFVSHQWFNPVGMDAADLGQAIAGPRTIGYSSQYIRNFTTGQDIDLGSDQRNLCLALRVDPIPSPSCASLLTASSLLALRRRRGFEYNTITLPKPRPRGVFHLLPSDTTPHRLCFRSPARGTFRRDEQDLNHVHFCSRPQVFVGIPATIVHLLGRSAVLVRVVRFPTLVIGYGSTQSCHVARLVRRLFCRVFTSST